MDKLCAKALIERIPCPDDRRVVHITITNDGIKLLAKIQENIEGINLLKNLTETEATQLSELLDKIR